MTEMDNQNNRSVIAEIASVYDWRQFEQFIHDLYAQQEHLQIELNHRRPGRSGRLREVDVFVLIGYSPHTLKLGIECKYWEAKVDGDVIDIVQGKKDDLAFDKFAIVTTNGYERGAEQYARDRGIDLFLIRAPKDSDFGYSGRVLKFDFTAIGSTVVKVDVRGTLFGDPANIAASQGYMDRLLHMELGEQSMVDPDPFYDIAEWNIVEHADGSATGHCVRPIGNLVALIEAGRREQTSKIHFGQPFHDTHTVRFPERPRYGIRFPNSVIFMLQSVSFPIEFYMHRWDLQIDRSQSYPLILENVIEQSITPIRQTGSTYRIDKTVPKQEIDYSKIPADVMGPDGARIGLLLSGHLSPPTDTVKEGVFFRLVKISENHYQWKPL